MAPEGQTAALPIVGVMGSGSSCDENRCAELGRWLATEGVHLLTGGGGGVMLAVSRAFFETRGRDGAVLGVLPADRFREGQPPAGYPNPWVEIPIRTHLHLSGARGTALASRNHINVLTSNVLVAMPGSWGTRSEVALALRYGKPVAAYLRERSEIPQLPASVPVLSDFAQIQGFVRRALGRAP